MISRDRNRVKSHWLDAPFDSNCVDLSADLLHLIGQDIPHVP